MAAVNMHMMSSSNNMPLDFMPLHHSPHSRSASVSSSSASSSRPHSSQGGFMQSLPPSADELYRASYHLDQLSSPGGHSSMYKSHNMRRSSHMARVAASPYPRDTDSVHSSSSETEDMGMYMGAGHTPDYALYGAAPPSVIAPSPHDSPAQISAGAFGRLNLGNDQGLEKLAGSVRAATTTSASDRAKQIFVQAWLTANYAPYPEGNVPRQGLYFSYRRVCDQYGIPHINTATLGKAIRLCFPSIKTRRLGVRGNSKYHYCGIRPATSTEAEWLQDYIHKTNNTAGQPAVNAGMRAAEHGDGQDGSGEDDEDDGSDGMQTRSASQSKRRSLSLQGDMASNAAAFSNDLSDKTPTASNLLSQAQAQRTSGSFPAHTSIRRNPQAESGLHTSPPAHPSSQYLPQTSARLSVRHFPNFPTVEEALGNNPSSQHNPAARDLWRWFESHLDGLLDNVRAFRFDQFEINLRQFWSSLTGHHRELAHAPAIAGLMAKADAIVYDEILEILRSQMLSPIPSQSLTGLRQFGNKMEKILLASLEGYGNTFVEPKVELGARFGHLVLRFLDIYQVTQALNTVLTNQKQLIEMRASWSKVDFESVRNQSALVCNCRHEDLVQLLEVEFVSVMDSLSKSNEPVREIMAWADKCCDRLMGSSRGGSEERSTMSSRSILIRWGYVTSQVMRDLTIRSDPAFGAFQILKLFLDDWIAVNVLRSVALSTNSVAASVEPVMQQQFLQLSPMPGQETFGHHANMAQTPTSTSSSMMAVLQQNDYSSSLDSSSSGYSSTESYGAMGYMDSSHASPEDSLPHPPSLFPDFSGSSGSYDFLHHQELNMPTVGTPGSEPESQQEVAEHNKSNQHSPA